MIREMRGLFGYRHDEELRGQPMSNITWMINIVLPDVKIICPSCSNILALAMSEQVRNDTEDLGSWPRRLPKHDLLRVAKRRCLWRVRSPKVERRILHLGPLRLEIP